MLVPVKWLKDYIKIDVNTRDLANKVTDSGSHVESINKYEDMSGLVVAHILDIRKHENADKLSLVDLNYGEKEVTLVTGAKNMKIGDNVVFATVGAKLPGGIVIKEAELQGIVSPGMLCGYSELGVSENSVAKESTDGLIILPKDAVAGTDAIKYLDLDNEIIEFEITPNRPDCLSIIGMAREVAAVYDTKIVEPNIEIENKVDIYSEYFNGVQIESENVNRFLTAVVKNVKIKESPMYIQNYLRDAGMRPVNNIVDFTNFVMLEYGQPLHAYDLDTIKEKSLLVRDGKDGETLVTLDDKERKVIDEDLLICDGEDTPIGFAGIMGGQSTEITKNTKNILIEAASFDSECIRKTSKRLNLRSEASSRFEKSVPAKLSEIAIKRFLKLVDETNSGDIVEGIEDKGDFIDEDVVIKIDNQRINDLLGLEFTPGESKKYLEALELTTEINENILSVTIPYFREDLRIEEDLVEEIGRLYGFHNIAPKPLIGELTKGVKPKLRNLLDKVRTNLYALGFSEILTYSFISDKVYEKLNLEKDSLLRDAIKILNPLGEDYSVMRTTLIGNMLEVIRKNLNNKQYDLRFSEVGNSFRKYGEDLKEEKLVTYSLVGDYDFYYTKNILINLLSKLGIFDIRFERETENPIFHAGRTANIIIKGKKVGVIGEISPFVLENFNIDKRVNLVEFSLNDLLEFNNEIIKYKEISKYPLVERDIAFVVSEDLESQDIIDTITENGGEYLRYVQLFDTYKGEQIEKGYVSLAYKIGFQSNESTLKDKVVKEAFENIKNALQEKYQIDLRS